MSIWKIGFGYVVASGLNPVTPDVFDRDFEVLSETAINVDAQMIAIEQALAR